ncbi:hypothetical protein NDU88_000521 [Pleurodeles waltl]|uniref:Uncharacterized protein n=1 Tax=Pleurodeles waltl TaxID=8319 RepID=A0AAV7TG43_PLEWA|nr:hypothetical protein NDU88_000521 [Pleurodeles waltl]
MGVGYSGVLKVKKDGFLRVVIRALRLRTSLSKYWDEKCGIEAETPQEVTTPAARIAGSEQGKRDSDEVWRQRRSKDGAEQGALSVFVYCRDQALSVSVRRALSVSVYRRDSRIE